MFTENKKVFIKYYIQNDAWESPAEPNLYCLQKTYTDFNEVKAKDIYDEFPLKKYDNYYLRFFLEIDNMYIFINIFQKSLG